MPNRLSLFSEGDGVVVVVHVGPGNLVRLIERRKKRTRSMAPAACVCVRRRELPIGSEITDGKKRTLSHLSIHPSFNRSFLLFSRFQTKNIRISEYSTSLIRFHSIRFFFSLFDVLSFPFFKSTISIFQFILFHLEFFANKTNDYFAGMCSQQQK